MTVDPDPLAERTDRLEHEDAPDEGAPDAKGTSEGARHVDPNRFTETTPEGDLRKVEGDPRSKLERIRSAKAEGDN